MLPRRALFFGGQHFRTIGSTQPTTQAGKRTVAQTVSLWRVKCPSKVSQTDSLRYKDFTELTLDKILILMTNHCCDPTEPLEKREAFEEKCIHRFEDTESPSIKQWNRNALLPEQRADCGEMKFTML